MVVAVMNMNFKEIFKYMLLGMRFNRCHPGIPRDRKWLCQFTIMHGTFTFVLCLLLYSTIFHDLKSNNFSQACANGTLCVVFCVVSFKYGVALTYQDLLKGLMDEMMFDYEAAKTLTLDEQGMVLKYAMKGKRIVNIWIIISILTGGLFLGKAFYLMTYYTIKGEFQLVPMYDITYPSTIEEMKYEPAIYSVLFVLFLFYDLYASSMYIAMAPLGPVYMLHSCGQLELVTNRLLRVFHDTDSALSTLKSLNDIIKSLQKTYSFLARVKESFKILYELTLKATVIILPILFYQIIESFHKNDVRIEFVIVILGSIAISAIPCYYSDKLMEMGEELRLAVYMCGWEAHLDRHKTVRTTLLLIQSRAARPIAIRTMFRTVSLDALTDVYQQAYAIFNVLNAALD